MAFILRIQNDTSWFKPVRRGEGRLTHGATVIAFAFTLTGVGAPVAAVLGAVSLATGAASTVIDCVRHEIGDAAMALCKQLNALRLPRRDIRPRRGGCRHPPR